MCAAVGTARCKPCCCRYSRFLHVTRMLALISNVAGRKALRMVFVLFFFLRSLCFYLFLLYVGSFAVFDPFSSCEASQWRSPSDLVGILHLLQSVGWRWCQVAVRFSWCVSSCSKQKSAKNPTLATRTVATLLTSETSIHGTRRYVLWRRQTCTASCNTPFHPIQCASKSAAARSDARRSDELSHFVCFYRPPSLPCEHPTSATSFGHTFGSCQQTGRHMQQQQQLYRPVPKHVAEMPPARLCCKCNVYILATKWIISCGATRKEMRPFLVTNLICSSYR